VAHPSSAGFLAAAELTNNEREKAFLRARTDACV